VGGEWGGEGELDRVGALWNEASTAGQFGRYVSVTAGPTVMRKPSRAGSQMGNFMDWRLAERAVGINPQRGRAGLLVARANICTRIGAVSVPYSRRRSRRC
jgi:hypothetical protein